MEKDTEAKRDEALSFLTNHSTGVLATTSPEGKPRARLVYYTYDDSFNIYFMTLANTRKAEDLKAHAYAAFVISEEDAPRTLQLEGVVTDLTDTATLDPTVENLIQTFMTNSKYGAPLTRFDASTFRFYRFTTEWARWGDFTFGNGTDAVFTEVPTQSPEI